MKNKAFNQTVAFTSASVDFSKLDKADSSSLNIEPSEMEIPEVEALEMEAHELMTEVEELQATQHQVRHHVRHHVQHHTQHEQQELIAPVLHTPVPRPQINMTSSRELNQVKQDMQQKVDQLEPAVGSGEQKVYDRFKRTVEVNTLELFEGDSNATGAAWMIRDQDDVIEHRERLGLDNSEFYEGSSKVKTILLFITISLSALGIWYLVSGM